MTHDDTLAVEVRGLAKTYRIGFFRKRVEAVRGIDFEVRAGEIFGLLGPNGAGKTTTLKSLLGLVRPTAGTLRVFGEAMTRRARARIGYLPENPYLYQYLRADEFLDLAGRLAGLRGADLRARTRAMIERVGLGHAMDRPIGRFSKGMMQRIGLAQALLHEPSLLILDEPMSGLDPIGRRLFRDLLLAERDAGRTLLFTSHILSDVEMLCNQVAIMNHGRVTAAGALDTLLRADVRRVEITLEDVSESLEATLRSMTALARRVDLRLVLTVEGDEAADRAVRAALDGGAKLASMTPERETLEDLFLREAVASE